MTRWTAENLKTVLKRLPGRPADRRTASPRDSTEGQATLPSPKSTKAPKYRNTPTNGYASVKEAKRAAELHLLEKFGQIRNLREQVDFELIPKQDGEGAVKYRADFVYEKPKEEPWPPVWEIIVEDVKGMRTPHYILKRKLMLWVHHIRIRET